MSTDGASQIVTDGLVWGIDAASKKSNPGTGSVAYSIGSKKDTVTFTSIATTGNQFTANASSDHGAGSLGAADIFPANASSATLEMWLKYTNSATNMYAIQVPQSTGSTWITVRANTDSLGQLSILRMNSSVVHTNISLTQGYNDGKWHYIVGSFNGPTATVYIDMELAGTDELGLRALPSSAPRVVLFGINTSSLPFVGSIGLCRLYDRGLSYEEILNNYNAQKGRFGR